MSIPLSVGQLSDLGIGQTSIRFAARAHEIGNEGDKFSIFRWAFRVRVLIVIVLILTLYFFAHYITYDLWHEDLVFNRLFRVTLIILFTNVIANITITYFQALSDFKSYGKILSGQKLLVLIGILIIALMNNWSLSSVVMVTILANILGAVVFAFKVPKEIYFSRDSWNYKRIINNYFNLKLEKNYDSNEMDTMGIHSFTKLMILSNIIITLIMQADIWLMGVFLSKSDIGIYNASVKFTIPLVVLLTSVQTVLWPSVSKILNREKVNKLLKKIFTLSVAACLISILYSFIVPQIAPIIFGSKFEGSIILGQLLCFRYSIALLINPVHMVGYNFGLVKIYWMINLIQLCAIIVVNILLLPIIGPVAAALALILNEIIGISFIYPIIWKKWKGLR